MNNTETFQVRRGTKREITNQMENELYLTQEQAEECFSFLTNHMDALSSDEKFFRLTSTESIESASAFMTDNMTYYVHLNRLSIYTILFLLGWKVNHSVEGGLFALISTRGKPIITLFEERPGSKCVALELKIHRKQGMSLRDLKKQFRISKREEIECFNNHYSCHLRDGGCCCLTEEKLKEILAFLKEEEIIKERLGRYYYKWF